jgi:hypothetical protein
MQRKLYLLSGGYGAGKTRFSRRMVGSSNTVALATAIRSDLFKIFKDTRFHSTSQKDKDSLISEKDLVSVLKKERIKGIPANIFRRFTSALGELVDFKNVSIREVMIIYGGCGRVLSKNYWVNRTIAKLKELEGDIAVDDVRYINELTKLTDFAKKEGLDVVQLWVGEKDSEYDNTLLYDSAEYKIDWM